MSLLGCLERKGAKKSYVRRRTIRALAENLMSAIGGEGGGSSHQENFTIHQIYSFVGQSVFFPSSPYFIHNLILFYYY